MKASTLLCSLIFFSFSLLGQAVPDTFKIYSVKVIGMDKSYNLEGALYAVTDSSILISNSFLKKDYYSENYEVSQILVNTILDSSSAETCGDLNKDGKVNVIDLQLEVKFVLGL